MSNTPTTHVATAPNKKPATAIQTLKGMMGTAEYMKQISNYYRGDRDEALRFLTASVEYIRRVPKLLECDPTSLLSALVQSAQFRFMPSSVAGEAYVIPYGREAKFQLGYQGIVTLLYRTSKIVGISANIIREKDHFDYEEGLEPHLIHKPAMFGKDAGEAIGVYTVAQMRGGARTFKVMDKEAVMAIKEMSKAKDRQESPWNSKDPELWMWKKTCLIQHAKLLPKTQELQEAISKDYEGEGIAKPSIDVAGPATGRAIHVPEEKITEPAPENGDGE